jgi:hypothetical protein
MTMKYKSFYIICFFAMLTVISCKKSELDIQNPNNPTPASATTESGIISLGLGAVYQNGFNGISDSRYTGSFLGSTYWFLGAGYHDLMADVISAEAANNLINQVGVPDYVILDNGTKITNSAPSKTVLRVNNSRTKAGSNPVYFEWTWMYFLNNACNNVLSIVNSVSFTGDSVSKRNAVKAWAYFWKGFAYAKIGSIYYAGLVKSDALALSNEYKASTEIIAESNANFDKAIAALNLVTNVTDYNNVLKGLIPTQNQVGKGGLLTPAMWIRNINTMKARNLLVNKRTKDMTAADWNAVLALVANGITSTDLVFTSRSAATGGYMSATGGTPAALSTGDPTGTTYKISERLIQEYNTGDKRLSNNFIQTATYLNQKGGFTFSTRFRMLDSGGVTKTYTASSITSKVVGAYELFIAGSYEENELMKAEANIKLGNIATGLASIDAVRNYQGAGLAATSGAITDPVLAYEELRKERRVGLIFRDVAYYDARRWGVLDDISAGGGRTKAVVVSTTGVLNTNATINYNFLDYWDVPDDELSLNPPSANSAPVKNPK